MSADIETRTAAAAAEAFWRHVGKPWEQLTPNGRQRAYAHMTAALEAAGLPELLARCTELETALAELVQTWDERCAESDDGWRVRVVPMDTAFYRARRLLSTEEAR